jgi:TPR repeat protein
MTVFAAGWVVCASAMATPAAATVADGLSAFERGQFEAAAKEFEAPAQAGDPQAQYLLGIMYLNEYVPPPAPDAAVKLIRSAADQGYRDAQTELARMYRSGDGVQADPAEMTRWYQRAAEQGDVGAQLLLADTYAYGQGVDRDLVQAYMWYEIAIQYWGPLAVRARDAIGAQMTADQIAQAVNRAGDWLKKNPGQTILEQPN